jgi:hypothetical protein
MNSNDELGLRRKTSESFFPSLIIFPFGISFHLPNHQSPSYFFSGEASSSSKYSVKLAIVQIEIGSPY